MIRKLARFVLRNPKAHAALKNLYASCSPGSNVESGLQTSIPEVSRIVVRKSMEKGRRINLLVPALSLRHVFGGISTALNFFQKLAVNFDNVRIIITDEVSFSIADNRDYSDWQILSLEDADCDGRQIVCAGDRWNRTLALREGDIFVATAWWTAIVAKDLLVQKKSLWQQDNEDKFVYLIQDYEPGFYPWSSRYALAESSYHNENGCIAVFNTSFLKQYFDAKGYVFSQSFVFEPVLHRNLRPFLSNCQRVERERSILVYGRPGVDRNAFELIIMALRLVVTKLDCSEWKFYSAGEAHPDVDLGNGSSLVSLGKLSIEAYGDRLQKTFAGISLMVSPHPSYPPLEMAAFGINVLTNRYDEKCLSELCENINSVDFISAESIADRMISIIGSYNSNPFCDLPQTLFFQNYRLIDDPFGDIVAGLADTSKYGLYSHALR